MAVLLDSTGNKAIVQEGESCNITATFLDFAGNQIAKASLITLTMTLFDNDSNTLINSRNAVSVLDANGGVVETNGTLTMRLQPADNVIVGSPATEKNEKHTVQFVFTFNDGVTTRTGKNPPFTLLVQQLAAPAAPAAP